MQNRTYRTPLVVLISGRGSNLRSLVQAVAAGELDCDIAGVICNRSEAAGLAWAASEGLSTRLLDHRGYADRASFDRALADAVDDLAAPWATPGQTPARPGGTTARPGRTPARPGRTPARPGPTPPQVPITAPGRAPWVALAGFMRILGDSFISRHQGRIVNIHPSLLPLYPGLHTHRRALADGALLHGATVHLVTTRLDHGPILAQAIAPVLAGDTEGGLADRILSMEHRLYPLALQWLVDGRVRLDGTRVLLDGSDAIDQRILWHPLLDATPAAACPG